MKNISLNLLLLALFSLILVPVAAQDLNEFGFTFWGDLPVVVESELLENPWAGGLNNVQFGKIDLNHDGIDDLIVFDRHGDRLLPFIYHPAEFSRGYTYAPEYRKYFPPIVHWFQLIDYNSDGFNDIFTYTPGGIMVYRNMSGSFPSFEQAVDPYITSLQGTIFTNLLVTYVDYPAIADLDGDGDLDILTFWGLGSFIEYHQNMSVEFYGSADSLVFHKISNCWGRFSEDNESNEIVFDTCFDLKGGLPASDPKHTGSTFLLTDISGNGTYDLILGDVDYSNVVALMNEGTNTDAAMTSQLPHWPVNEPVDLWSFPLAQRLDINNDGKDELLVSPFDPSLVKSEGSECVWLYDEDLNGSGGPACNLYTKSFLQSGMIDLGLGAYPVFADVNVDGLTDLIAGNYGLYDTCTINENGQLKCYYTGRISLYLNNGTVDAPSFILADDDFGQLSQFNLQGVYPAFADMDGDSDIDMVVGNSEGNLWLFTNSAEPGNLPVFGMPSADFQNLKVEGFSTPVFCDVDGNGKSDLVLGSVNGKLSFFQNSGTSGQPVFELITDNFGKVNVTNPDLSYKGYSVPCFFRMPGGDLRLLVGSETGLLKYYSGISADTTLAFILKDEHFMYITEGIRTSATWSDLNNDGYPDLAIGNYSGGIALFKGTPPGPSGMGAITPIERPKLSIRPNPGNGKITLKIFMEGYWQIKIFTASGLLIKEIPAEGFMENELTIEKPRSGVFLINAQCVNKPWLQLNGKAVIIR